MSFLRHREPTAVPDPEIESTPSLNNDDTSLIAHDQTSRSKIEFKQRLYIALGNLVGAFDKMLSLYVDGVPMPRVANSDGNDVGSYQVRHPRKSLPSWEERESKHLGALIEVVPLVDNSAITSDFFVPLCTIESFGSPSARIGSHLSKFVGSFSFVEDPNTRKRLSRSIPSLAIPKRSLSSAPDAGGCFQGSLPIAAFVELFDDEKGDEKDEPKRILPSPPADARVPSLKFKDHTFLTAAAVEDPSIEPVTALCRVISYQGPSLERTAQWEPCEVVHHDPVSATFRVRIPNVHNHDGSILEKTVTRACLALGGDSRNDQEAKIALAAKLRNDFEKKFRTDLFLQLWETEEAEQQALDDDVVRRVLKLSTSGLCKEDIPLVGEQLKEARSMCGVALNRAKLEYLCCHPHFQKLIAPLDLHIPEIKLTSQFTTADKNTSAPSTGIVRRACVALNASLRWSPASKKCMEELSRMWNDKYENLVLLDTRYAPKEIVPLPSFLRNARYSLDVGIEVMKNQLLSDVDVTMMTELHRSDISYTHINVKAYLESKLYQMFLFVKMMLITNLRRLGTRSTEAMVKLFSVPSCPPAVFGVVSDNYFHINGMKPPAQPHLMIELKYIEGGKVKVFPELQRVEGELLELVDDMVKGLNSFPKADMVIMASLQLPASTMDVLSTDDVEIVAAKRTIQSAVAFASPTVQNLIEAYGKFAQLVEKFVVIESEYFEKPDLSNAKMIERIENEIYALRKILEQVRWTSADVVSCGVLSVDCSHAKKNLLSQWEGKIKSILEMMEKRIFTTSVQSVRACKKIRQRLTTRPTCAEELDELLAYSDEARRTIESISIKEVEEVVSWVGLLERLQYPIAEEVYQQAYQLVSWPAIIAETMRESEELFIKERQAMKEELEEYKTQIHKLVRELDTGVTALLGVTEQEKSDIAVNLAKNLRSLSEEIEQRIVVASRREGMLGVASSDFDSFLPVRSTFEALEQFWVTLTDSYEHIQRYYDTPISEANADKMIENVERWRRNMRAATRSLRGYTVLFNLGRKQEHFIMLFERATPIIEMLTQAGVRQIHWREISRKIGATAAGRELLPTDPGVTIQRLLNEGVMDHTDEISVIVAQAATDFAAETRLEKMKSDTRKQLLVFQILEMPSGQVHALENSAEIVALLDNFVVQSQQLHTRFNLQGSLAQAAADWENMLLTMQETMSLWMTLQTDWLQLRPTVLVPSDATAVVSQDIVLRFKQVDDSFRQVIDELDRTNQNLFVVMTMETLPTRLNSIASQLRHVREGILLLMDAKRTIFPRFYFLNDKEMLTCLSAMNIRAVTSLLQRMYPKLFNLDLHKGDVSGFVSSDGVKMRCEPHFPVTSEPIEAWMKGLENSMQKSLRSAVDHCLQDCTKTQMKTWLLKFSGQLIDVCSRIRYAQDIEEVLAAVGTTGLQSYLKKSSRMLEEYFRVSSAELGANEHRIVANAISFVLFCREEVQALVDEGVTCAEHLETFPILRTKQVDGQIVVKLFHLTIPYGLEFLGNYSAPVITPIMFRNTRALFLSHVALVKTVLAGSGGVGKKQTVADFATYLGTFLWSVQCHSALTVATLTPLLRALIGIGGWLCLDDIEKLTPQVQEQVSRLVAIIDAAQRSQSKETPLPIGKDGEEVRINVGERFNVLASTALSYSQIPAVLSSTFRPMFLHNVDFSVIAKAHLCSLGFEDEFVSLGDALGSVFAQFHDILPGVFSVGSLVMTLRLAKSVHSHTLGGKIVHAMQQTLRPALSHNPELEQLFDERLDEISPDGNDLMPSFARSGRDHEDVTTAIEFDKLMQVNTNVIVYGPHFSGKHNLVSSWANTRDTIVVATRAVSTAMYYGDGTGHTGLLSRIFKECSEPGDHVLWFENTDLRDEEASAWAQCASTLRRVHMDTHTCVVMGSDTKVIATTTSLKNAAPSIVARFSLFSCGEVLPWQEHLRVLGKRFESEVPQLALALGIVETMLEPLVDALQSTITLHDAAHIVLELFRRWFNYITSTSTHTSRTSADKQTSLMVQCCVFGVTWGLGLRLERSDRSIFERAIHDTQDAVNALVCQHDSTIEAYPPGDCLNFYPGPTGWKEVVVDGATDSWCNINPTESKFHRGWALFASPQDKEIHFVVEMLLRCGQHVFVTGSEQCGKTHLVNRVGIVSGWINHVIAANKDTPVAALQETLVPRLVKRQSRVYGPPIGKQLVLCVDDMHLGAVPSAEDSTLNECALAHVLSFLAKRSKLCTVGLGVIGLRDTVFLATGLPTDWTSPVARSCVEVRMPPVQGSHILRQVWTLLERCSGHRNISDIAREATSFLLQVHDAFLCFNAERRSSVAESNFVFLERRASQSEEPCGSDGELDASASHISDDEEDDAIAALVSNKALRQAAERSANKNVHLLFHALDAVRRLMHSALPDAQIVRCMVPELFRVYSSTVATDKRAGVEEIVGNLAIACFSSIDSSSCGHDDVTASILTTTETNNVERLVASTKKKRINEWVVCFNRAPAFDLAPLTTPFTSVSQVSLTNSHGGLSAFRNKLLLSYKVNQMILSGTNGGTGPQPSPQQLQQLEWNSVISPSSKTMMTDWLHTHIPALLAFLEAQESNLVLVGSQTFGVTRLVRLVTAIADVPVFICQCDSPNYNFQSWREDLRTLIRYAAKKGVRVALFIPSAALSIPGILSDVDTFVRTGSCAPFFTLSELSIMLDTAKKTNALAVGGPEKLDPTVEFDYRMRTQTMIITHFTSLQAMENARLSYPAFASRMSSHYVGDRSDWNCADFVDLATSSLMSSYALRILPTATEDAAGGNSAQLKGPEGRPNSASSGASTPVFRNDDVVELIDEIAATADVVCDIFSRLAKLDEGIVEEQIIEFAQLVGYLQKKRIPEVARVARQAAAYDSIKSTIALCIQKDSSTRKELSPEFDQLNEVIGKLEKSVAAATVVVDGQRKSFETLESSTVHMVTLIEAKKQQMKQLNNTIDANLQQARQALLQVDPKHMKTLAATIVPPARTRVLMDAVYLIIGEEIPKSAATQQDVWNSGRRLICDNSFVQRITSIGPDALWLPSFDELKPLMDNFDVARFGSFSPYAQAVADLITAITAGVAMREKSLELEFQISESRVEMLTLVDDLEKARDSLFGTSKKLDEERRELGVLRDRRSYVYDVLQNCEQRLMRLHRLASFVDVFEQHITRNVEHLESLRENIFGDILITATRLSIVGCQTREAIFDSMNEVLRALDSRNIRYSRSVVENYLAVLQQEPLILTHYTLGIKLPQSQVQLLAGLTKRCFFRWPLFSATNSLFEECVIQQLKDSCVDCVITSASAPNIVAQVQEAVRQGYGVVVRNFNGNDILRKLKPVLSLLSTMMQHQQEEWNSDVLQVQLYGKVVTVHPKFYLVFTMREVKGDLALDTLRSMQQWLTVHRIHDGCPFDAVVAHTLTSYRSAGSGGSLLTDYRVKAKEHRNQTGEFYKGKFASARLITERRETIADDEPTIAELGVEVGRMERAAMQSDRHRQMAENVLSEISARWQSTIASIATILEVLRVIEKKFGRDVVEASFLPDVIESSFGSSAFVLSYFRAERVQSLNESEQGAALTLIFVEKLLLVFRPGWPEELRNIFALAIIATAHNTPVFRNVGVHSQHDEEKTSRPTTATASESNNMSLDDVRDMLAIMDVFSTKTSDMLIAAKNRNSKGTLLKAAVAALEAEDGVQPIKLPSASPAGQNKGKLSEGVKLFEAWLTGDMSECNAAASRLLDIITPKLFGELYDKDGLPYTTSVVRDGDAAELFRFCSQACVPLHVESRDVPLTIESMKHEAFARKVEIEVVYVSGSDCDPTSHLEGLAQQVRIRPTKERAGHWRVFVLEPCDQVDVEVRVSFVQQVCNTIPLLRDSYYSTLCNNQRAVDEPNLVVFFVSDIVRTNRDVDNTAKARSLGFSMTLNSPKQHLLRLLNHKFAVQPSEWTTDVSNPIHYRLNCLVKGLVFLHAHVAHRQRLDRIASRDLGVDATLFVMDADLTIILSLLRVALSPNRQSLFLYEPFTTMRNISIFIYGARATREIEEERLLMITHRFVHRSSISSAFRFMDAFGSDPEQDLSALTVSITNTKSELCELSGDLGAHELLQEQLKKEATDFLTRTRRSTPEGRRRSSIGAAIMMYSALSRKVSIATSMMRSRRSTFVPDAPHFRKSIIKVDQRRQSTLPHSSARSAQDQVNQTSTAQMSFSPSFEFATLDTPYQSEGFSSQSQTLNGDTQPLWELEISKLQEMIAASADNAGALEQRMLLTLTKLSNTSPLAVKAIWLPALQFPLLFLQTFLHARQQQVVQDERKGVYATFAFVCLQSTDRVKKGDLILSGAFLPERRLRNQKETVKKTRDSAGTSRRTSVTFDESAALSAFPSSASADQWHLEENIIVVIRACPRSFVPTTHIPMLQSENLMSKVADDEGEVIELATMQQPNSDEDEDIAANSVRDMSGTGWYSMTAVTTAVQAERVNDNKDKKETADLLSENFVGGPGFAVFLGRLKIPLLCHSVIPQTGKRRWRNLLNIPLIVERSLNAPIKVLSPATLEEGSLRTPASVRTPIPPRSGTNLSKRSGRRATFTEGGDTPNDAESLVEGPEMTTAEVTTEAATERPNKQSEQVFAEPIPAVAAPTPRSSTTSLGVVEDKRYYWLPLGLQYSVHVE